MENMLAIQYTLMDGHGISLTKEISFGLPKIQNAGTVMMPISILEYLSLYNV